MLEDLRALLRALRALRSGLPRGGGARVRAGDLKAAAKAIVETYFRNVRPFVGPTALARAQTCDREMQVLLALSNSQAASASKYSSLAKSIAVHLGAIEGFVLAGSSSSPAMATTDQQILDAIRALPLPSAALAYEQGLRDLEGAERLSWRGPATDLRESLRETLDFLAPDDRVAGQPNFRLESGQKGPTIKQKMRYVLKQRGLGDSERGPIEDAAEGVEEILGRFVRSVYARSSVSAHTPTTRDEVTRVRELVRVALCEILGVR